MKQLIKRLSRVADSSSSSSSCTTTTTTSYSLLPPPRTDRKTRRRSVPSGHLPVYVGEEMERFVVNADLMNHPVFVKLLNKSAQEYGYQQKGALRIPCNVLVFEKILHIIRHGGDLSPDALDVINSLLSSTDDLSFL